MSASEELSEVKKLATKYLSTQFLYLHDFGPCWNLQASRWFRRVKKSYCHSERSQGNPSNLTSTWGGLGCLISVKLAADQKPLVAIAQKWLKFVKENVMGWGGLTEVRSEIGKLWKPASLLRNQFGEGITNLSVFLLSLLIVLRVDWKKSF